MKHSDIAAMVMTNECEEAFEPLEVKQNCDPTPITGTINKLSENQVVQAEPARRQTSEAGFSRSRSGRSSVQSQEMREEMEIARRKAELEVMRVASKETMKMALSSPSLVDRLRPIRSVQPLTTPAEFNFETAKRSATRRVWNHDTSRTDKALPPKLPIPPIKPQHRLNGRSLGGAENCNMSTTSKTGNIQINLNSTTNSIPPHQSTSSFRRFDPQASRRSQQRSASSEPRVAFTGARNSVGKNSQRGNYSTDNPLMVAHTVSTKSISSDVPPIDLTRVTPIELPRRIATKPFIFAVDERAEARRCIPRTVSSGSPTASRGVSGGSVMRVQPPRGRSVNIRSTTKLTEPLSPVLSTSLRPKVRLENECRRRLFQTQAANQFKGIRSSIVCVQNQDSQRSRRNADCRPLTGLSNGSQIPSANIMKSQLLSGAVSSHATCVPVRLQSQPALKEESHDPLYDSPSALEGIFVDADLVNGSNATSTKISNGFQTNLTEKEERLTPQPIVLPYKAAASTTDNFVQENGLSQLLPETGLIIKEGTSSAVAFVATNLEELNQRTMSNSCHQTLLANKTTESASADQNVDTEVHVKIPVECASDFMSKNIADKENVPVL